MKFAINKNSLSKALALASHVVERRNTIPILSNAVLQVEGGALSLRTTDLDLEISLSLPAEVEVSGVTTAPAALLHDIVRKLAGDQVTFALDAKGNELVVGAGRSTFKLQCLPESDFPDLTIGTFSHSFELPAADLRKLLKRTSFAISTEETRYYLNGIFMHTDEDRLVAVATDGHRLARCQTAAPSGSVGMPGIIVPRKTVGDFEKLLDLGDLAKVELSESKIRLTVGSTVITSKLIDGTFPDYKRVIPTDSNVVAIADSKTISAAADRVATVSSERGRAVKMNFEENKLSLVVNNPDSGSAEDEVEIQYDADPVSIGFNNKYLQDILANLTSKTVRISLTDSGSPTVFRDEQGDDTLFVLMPMRV